MPSFPYTPEALLGRNDSKNPAATCKGITASGRPCRRALASRKASLIGKRNAGLGRVVALVQEECNVQEADFYCWQHKDQAEQRIIEENRRDAGRRLKRRSIDLYPVKERRSIDTMVQKLGIEAMPVERRRRPMRKDGVVPRLPRSTDTWDFAQHGPSPHAEKHDFMQPTTYRPKQKHGFWASLCCSNYQHDDYVEIVRHRRPVDQTRLQHMSASAPPRTQSSRPGSNTTPPRPTVPNAKAGETLTTRPAAQHRDSSRSHTGQLLSFIPQQLSAQTTSTLLAELLRPISPHDEEGYIYIFWLTPQTKAAPAKETARCLLSPNRPKDKPRISDVMTEYSCHSSEPTTLGKKTITLKIGRASNITRRMNEWQRQCGYALNLVRWYPYVPSSSSATPSPSGETEPLFDLDVSRTPTQQRRESDVVRKVPCVKRVERLIHLELAEKRVKRQCMACGKEHREWFEVEASQSGVEVVDACIRRWVGWAERQGVTR